MLIFVEGAFRRKSVQRNFLFSGCPLCPHKERRPRCALTITSIKPRQLVLSLWAFRSVVFFISKRHLHSMSSVTISSLGPARFSASQVRLRRLSLDDTLLRKRTSSSVEPQILSCSRRHRGEGVNTAGTAATGSLRDVQVREMKCNPICSSVRSIDYRSQSHFNKKTQHCWAKELQRENLEIQRSHEWKITSSRKCRRRRSVTSEEKAESFYISSLSDVQWRTIWPTCSADSWVMQDMTNLFHFHARSLTYGDKVPTFKITRVKCCGFNTICLS